MTANTHNTIAVGIHRKNDRVFIHEQRQVY
jgi:hypothetical protein